MGESFFITFPLQSPDEIFYQTNTFLQTDVKVELQIKIENDISIVNRTDDLSGYHRMIFMAIYPFVATWHERVKRKYL